MNRFAALIALAIFTTALPLEAEGWITTNASGTPAAILSYDADHIHYKFSCVPDGVIAENFGVTQLLDVKTGTKIGDGPADQITPGASYMALAVDKVNPSLAPATASKNPQGGYDFRMTIAHSDPLLVKLSKTTTVSLFTTGYTALVVLNKSDRQRLATFLRDCH